jgi:hypothetical protein
LGRQAKPLDRARWECTLTTAGAVLATSSESARERPSRRVGEAEFDMRGLPGCPQCANLRRARLLPGWLGRKLSLLVARRSGPLLGQAPALPARGTAARRTLQHGADPIRERRNDASQESGFRHHSRGRVRLPESNLDTRWMREEHSAHMAANVVPARRSSSQMVNCAFPHCDLTLLIEASIRDRPMAFWPLAGPSRFNRV